jgi:hypothetical protein
MKFTFLRSVLTNANPTLTPDEVDALLEDAVSRCRLQLKDWDRYEQAVDYLTTLLFSDFTRKDLPLHMYLESLYAIVRHAPFAAAWREEFKRARKPVPVQ